MSAPSSLQGLLLAPTPPTTAVSCKESNQALPPHIEQPLQASNHLPAIRESLPPELLVSLKKKQQTQKDFTHLPPVNGAQVCTRTPEVRLFCFVWWFIGFVYIYMLYGLYIYIYMFFFSLFHTRSLVHLLTYGTIQNKDLSSNILLTVLRVFVGLEGTMTSIDFVAVISLYLPFISETFHFCMM